jgi:hypothetical protein
VSSRRALIALILRLALESGLKARILCKA